MDQVPLPDDNQNALRDLPSVDYVLRQPTIAALTGDYPRDELVNVVRQVVDARRLALRAGRCVSVDVRDLARDIRQALYERAQPRLRKVINATGVVLHTNLGRAPLAEEALDAVVAVGRGYCNLELDLASGRRGDRHEHVRDLLRELTGAEDALVVNNCAAATYLTLNTLADGGEVVVSRGQLVEIGGSYRLPDIMQAARCRLVEVGATNRTRIGDYAHAITSGTRVLLRVHTSNYRVIGFTHSPTLDELVALGRERGVPVVDDLGSGLLRDDLLTVSGADEPTVCDSIAAGADLALFSGDKLLGGPQAGIIVGSGELVTRLRKNPLARAVRPDKLTLAALEATLRLYRDPGSVGTRVPTLRLLQRDPGEISAAAERLAEVLKSCLPECTVEVQPDSSETGGGSLPTTPLPTHVVAVATPEVEPDAIASGLRAGDTPVICRISDRRIVLDLRTVEDADVDTLAAALAEAVRELRPSPGT